MRSIRSRVAAVFGIVVLALAIHVPPAAAQAWRGMGRVAGAVKDDSGKPIEGVNVKLFLPAANGGMTVKTNKKGEWAAAGIARGDWQIDLEKDGYEPRHLTASVNELTRIPPMEITMKAAAPTVDPNVEIREGLMKAAGLLQQKKFADARAIYEQLYAKYPQAHQLVPLIARTYYGEGNLDKAIEQLRAASAQDPNNIDVKLLLGNVLIEKGQVDEGKQVLASIDESRITSPTTYVNVGIDLLNQGKAAEAATFFTKAIDKFPQAPDAYYYRGLAELQQSDNTTAKADLAKFIELAPNAPEAANAKKILEMLK